MQFLADESCDFGVIRALREAGHDVVAIIETHRGVSDETVVALALAEDRVLLTEDKDFGQLVFAAARESSGVVFIRWPVSSRASLPVSLLEFLASSADRLQGIFAVVEPGRVRVTRLP